jgi:hypothetical protein
MLRFVHSLIVALLVFTGFTAMVGGGLLMLVPGGEALGMSEAMLWRTPFDSFQVPGLVLFAAIGLGSLLTVGRVLRRAPQYPYYVMVQGGLLFCYIAVEMITIRRAHPFQLLYAFISVGLFEMGGYLARRVQPKTPPANEE